MATSDGARVRLHRSLGQRPDARLDPLLMLDEFVSDDPDDDLAGFPEHPHRGFETVTYMLEGHMLHQDHLGNRGHLKSGGAQWMTAGRGILHSEMPQQVAGRMHGFQLWINLPAREKMKAAGYRDVEPEEIPLARLGGGATARVLAGTINGEDGETSGPITGVATEPVFVDLFLPAGAEVTLPVAHGHNALAYVYDGHVAAGPDGATQPLTARQAGLFGEGSALRFAADGRAARLLVIAARPLGEPVVQYGPFVMNRREEIEQALADYRDGTLAG
jgi:redox-sensitive bicupin YhaK (pirin superfamily)